MFIYRGGIAHLQILQRTQYPFALVEILCHLFVLLLVGLYGFGEDGVCDESAHSTHLRILIGYPGLYHQFGRSVRFRGMHIPRLLLRLLFLHIALQSPLLFHLLIQYPLIYLLLIRERHPISLSVLQIPEPSACLIEHYPADTNK